MKRLLSFILCLMLLMTCFTGTAGAQIQEIDALCRTPESPDGVVCPLLISGDQIYIASRTAAALAGYELISERAGCAQFSLGTLDVSYTGPYLAAGGQCWYPLESIMDTLHTRVATAGGELIFNPVSSVLSSLNEAIESRWRMRVGIDPNDNTMAFGLNLAKLFNIFSKAAIADLFDNSYEKGIYRAAIFNLLQRSIDPEQTGFGELIEELEENVTQPLSYVFGAADFIFSEEVMQAFYGSSELGALYDLIEAYNAVPGAMDFQKLAEMGDYVLFYGSMIDSGATGLDYLLDAVKPTKNERLILDTVRQSLGVYRGLTDDSLSYLGDLYWEMGSNLGHSALQEAMLGKAGSLVVQAISKGAKDLLPSIAAMDGLEKCAAFYELQQLADEQIERALDENDYHRLKYSLILYYRCAYLYVLEAKKMEIKGMGADLRKQQNALNEIESQLLALPDSAVSLLTENNPRIYPRALLGPSAAYASFYSELAARYGVLDIKDYFGTEYIEEGSGIIAPWIHCVDENTVLTILRQEGSELIQMVFLDQGTTGSLTLIDERVVLTCGSSGSVYYGFEDESGPLLSCVSFDTDLTSFSCAGTSLETAFHPSDSSADSMSAMRRSAWKHLYRQFGEYEPSFYVDGSGGLFTISHSPAELRARFLEEFNRPD